MQGYEFVRYANLYIVLEFKAKKSAIDLIIAKKILVQVDSWHAGRKRAR